MTAAMAGAKREIAPQEPAQQLSDNYSLEEVSIDHRHYRGDLQPPAAGANEQVRSGGPADLARSAAHDASAATLQGGAGHEAPGRSSAVPAIFGSGSWAPAGRGAVDLKLNAEMVISGRAQPGQAVQVNGQWLKVRTDGTFSVRLALPLRE